MSDHIKITPILTDIPMPPMSAVPDHMAVRRHCNQILDDLYDPIAVLDGIGVMFGTINPHEYGNLGHAMDVILRNVLQDLRRVRDQVKALADAAKAAQAV